MNLVGSWPLSEPKRPRTLKVEIVEGAPSEVQKSVRGQRGQLIKLFNNFTTRVQICIRHLPGHGRRQDDLVAPGETKLTGVTVGDELTVEVITPLRRPLPVRGGALAASDVPGAEKVLGLKVIGWVDE